MTLRSRIILVLITAIVCGTLFVGAKPPNASVTFGLLFMSVLFPLFEQTSQLSTFISMREIFYKQRAANFFQTSAYVLSVFISQIPLALPESWIFGAFVYWISGLEASASGFILFELIIFLTVVPGVFIFFFVTAISPNIYIANPLTLGILQIVIVFSGFVVTRSQLPDYLIWLYWINPIAWAFRALAVTQYRSDALDVCIYEGINYCSQFNKTMGEYYLSTYDIPASKEWVVYGIVYLLAVTFIFMVLSFFALEYKRYDSDFGAKRVPVADHVHDASHYLLETPSNGSRTRQTSTNNSRGDAVKVEVSSHEKPVFEPVTLAFKDLWYSVPNPHARKESINLLKGIDGFARPGTITALMGSSGAGKTTLIDVIAGRKNTGRVRGKILLNGHEASDLSIRRCTGYCEQMDIHSETATFREALGFSAFLRQGSNVSVETKLASVDECLDLLGLRNIADQMVRGSSMEQMKRLTIGVELAAQPSVLFLDEPTSGLDARFAKLIIDGIRKVADSGRTVICTIHQPSYQVFSSFDNLLLLKRGGETVYFGELGDDCKALISYFEAIPGVPRLVEGQNPAAWMLECIGAGVNVEASSTDAIDFAKIFRESTLNSQMVAYLEQEGVGRPSTSLSMLTFSSKRAASSITQLRYLLQRFMDMYWRSPEHTLTIWGVALGSLVLLGFSSLELSMTSYQGICSGLGLIFVAFQLCCTEAKGVEVVLHT